MAVRASPPVRADADRSRPLVTAGVLAAVAGAVGLVTIAYRYVVDVGWTGTGSVLVDGRDAAAASAVVAGLALVIGAVAVLSSRRLTARSAGGAVLLAAAVLAPVAVAVGVEAYPEVEQATLIAHGPAHWQVRLPVTEVWGLADETSETVTVVGRADRRGCDWHVRSVTLDRATGTVLEVRRQPTEFQDHTQIPPEPEPLPAERFDVEQGSAPFICQG